MLPLNKLRDHHTAAVRTVLKERLAPTTVNKMPVALCRVLQEAHRLDLMESKDFHNVVNIANVKGTGQLRDRLLVTAEIKIVGYRTDVFSIMG